MTINVHDNINYSAIIARTRSQRLWLFAATEWHKLYHQYVPYATGTLANTIRIDATDSGAKITHTVPYAHYQYYGARFNFRHDLHPMGGSQWDQRAKPKIPALVRSLEDYIRSGRAT